MNQHSKPNDSRRGAVLCLIVWAAAAVLMTLSPRPEWSGAHALYASPVPATAREWLDAVANVLFYVPLGVVLAHLVRWRNVVMIALCISIATELLQIVIPGRSPSSTDVLTNTCGAYLGALVMQLIRVPAGWRMPVARATSYLSLAWAGGVVAVFMATAFMLQPIPPGGRRYHVPGRYFDRAPEPLVIGARSIGSRSFSGRIDEVRLYARSRSADAIATDLQSPVGQDSRSRDSLVAAYDFDERAGLVLRDASGGGHDGVITGGEWADGRFGGALSFDGKSTAVLIPYAPAFDLVDGMTIEAWVFPIGTPTEWPRIFGHAGDSYYLAASSDTGRLHPAVVGNFGGADESIRSSMALPTRQWSHVAASYDAETLRLYVNGRLVASERLWAPHRANKVTMNGVDITSGFIDARGLRSSLQQDVDIRATVVCGQIVPERARILDVVAPGNIPAFSLMASGEDFIFRPPTLGRNLGLPSPDHRVPGFFRDCPRGAAAAISIRGPAQKPSLRLADRAVTLESPGIGSGWKFLLHSVVMPSWLQTAATCLWLASLAVPFGFWVRANTAGVIAAGLLVLGPVMIPMVWQVPPLNTVEWAAFLLGAATGATWRRS